jgi:hypothetical protein
MASPCTQQRARAGSADSAGREALLKYILRPTIAQARIIVRLLDLLTEDREVKQYLRAIGEPTELPTQESPRPPPYWTSPALRRQELGDAAA